MAEVKWNVELTDKHGASYKGTTHLSLVPARQPGETNWLPEHPIVLEDGRTLATDPHRTPLHPDSGEPLKVRFVSMV